MLLFSCQVVSDSSWPHGPHHTSFLCPSSSPGVCPSSCPMNWWSHPTISSSVTLFSFCLQSSPASGSFPMSQLFTSGGQSTGASASALVLPKSIQGWSCLELTGLTSLQSKGLLRVFSSTIVQKHQFFSALPNPYLKGSASGTSSHLILSILSHLIFTSALPSRNHHAPLYRWSGGLENESYLS